MSAVWASLIAVAGTLIGSFSTYLFQQRATRRAEDAARHERLRHDRLTACSDFAAAVTDLKRGVVTAWFLRDREVAKYHTALTEADRLGAVAHSAKFRMLLLIDDPGLHELAATALGHMDTIRAAADLAELKAREAKFEADLTAFITAGAQMLR